MTVTISTDLSPPFVIESTAAAVVSARRAVLADRYAAHQLAVEWRPLAGLEPIVAAWRELAAQALEPNVFYEPAFALAAAPVFGADVGVLLVWSGTNPRRLLGLFPARIESRRYGLKLPVLVGWTHPYAPLGVPLIEREAAEPVVAAVLAHLAAASDLPGLLLLPFLRVDGAFAATLDAIVRRAQIPVADFDARRRAMFAPGPERSLYVERALGARKLKELRRLGRRLAETGAVMFSAATERAAVTVAAEDFLALEATGWKGKAGTAAVDDADLRRFVRTAIAGLAEAGQVAVERILVDGRAVAAAILLRSGRGAWFWKIAYDETFARFSPGVLITVALTEDLVDDATIAQADSCATENHPMIDHVWRERLTLADRLIGVASQAPFDRARHLEALRAVGIGAAKSIRAYFKR
jgi:CelD/BcsL family acetyltransferase involved in cellulose biosynthesis